MKHCLTVIITVLLLGAGLALGAGATGTWKAEFETPDGTKRTNTFALEQNGDKLTGTVSGSQDTTKIEGGTVKGDAIAFEAERPFGHFKYQGTITADALKLKVTFNGETYEITAKKQP